MSLTILFFGFLHALPVAFVALTAEEKSNDRIFVTAVIMSIIALLVGQFVYALIDLFFVWGAYLAFANTDSPSQGRDDITTPTTDSQNDFIRNLERNLSNHSGLRSTPPVAIAPVRKQVKTPLPEQNSPVVKVEEETSSSIGWLVLAIVVACALLLFLFNLLTATPSRTAVNLYPQPHRPAGVSATTEKKPSFNVVAPATKPASQAQAGSKPANPRGDLRHCLNLPTNEEITACATGR